MSILSLSPAVCWPFLRLSAFFLRWSALRILIYCLVYGQTIILFLAACVFRVGS